MSCSQPAYSVSEIHAIAPSSALNRTMMNSECDRVTLAQRNHFGSRLHSRSLLRQYELSTFKIPSCSEGMPFAHIEVYE